MPIRSASASRCAGRSGLPLSSLASISTTQRAWRQPAGLRGLDREQRRERGVAVVGAAAAVEPVALDHRRPRAEAVAPAGHLRLLVEVAVEQHGVVGRPRVGGAGSPSRSAGVRPGSSWTSTVRPAIGRGRAPVADQLDGRVHVAVRVPVGVEHRRHVGDADVVVQASGRMSSVPRPGRRAARRACSCRRGHRPCATAGRWMRSASATIRRTVAGRHQRVDRADALAAGHELPGRVDLGAVGRAEVVDAGLRRRRPPARGTAAAPPGAPRSGSSSRCARPGRSCRCTARLIDGAVLGGGEQRLLVAVHGAGLGRGDEPGADPHAVGAEREARRRGRGRRTARRRRRPAPARRPRRRPAARAPSWRRAGVPAGLGALGDDEVAPAGDRADARGAPCRTCCRRGCCCEWSRSITSRGTPRPATKMLRAAVDDGLDAALDLTGQRGQQVDAERLRRSARGPWPSRPAARRRPSSTRPACRSRRPR